MWASTRTSAQSASPGTTDRRPPRWVDSAALWRPSIKMHAMRFCAMADAFQRQLASSGSAALGFEERLGFLVEAAWTTRGNASFRTASGSPSSAGPPRHRPPRRRPVVRRLRLRRTPLPLGFLAYYVHAPADAGCTAPRLHLGRCPQRHRATAAAGSALVTALHRFTPVWSSGDPKMESRWRQGQGRKEIRPRPHLDLLASNGL